MPKKALPKKAKHLPEKPSIYHTHKQNLTQTQQEVLFLWSKEFLTITQISNRRQTSERAVRYTLKSLEKKGYLDKEKNVRKKKLCGINFLKHDIRFHGLEFNIKILFQDNRYKAIKEKTNFLEIDGNTIRLFRNSIEVYINKSFYAESVESARKEGFDYAYHLFNKLEQQLKVLIVKDRVQNIKLVKQHFSEVNNELAKSYNLEKKKLQIKGDDGKTWLLIDNSENLHELECIHPELAEQDMKKIKPFFDDLRENPVKISDIMLVLKEIGDIHKETSAGLNSIVELMKPKKDLHEKEKSFVKPDYIG